jgi:hypothetical protein
VPIPIFSAQYITTYILFIIDIKAWLRNVKLVNSIEIAFYLKYLKLGSRNHAAGWLYYIFSAIPCYESHLQFMLLKTKLFHMSILTNFDLESCSRGPKQKEIISPSF